LPSIFRLLARAGVLIYELVAPLRATPVPVPFLPVDQAAPGWRVPLNAPTTSKAVEPDPASSG